MSVTSREYFDAVCSECHEPCKTPFRPDPSREVYCQSCFHRRKDREKTAASARLKQVEKKKYESIVYDKNWRTQ